MSVISKKICLVGDFSVGKTSLIRRFVDRQFSDRYLSTVGVKISRKSVEVPAPEGTGNQQVQLIVWDIEGQTKFKAIAPSYLQGAKGAIIVADVTRSETIENLQQHLDLFFSVCPKGLAVIALNKLDLVSEEELEAQFKLVHFPEQPQVIAAHTTSAKTGKDVDEIFHKLAYNMLKIK
ncbi:MAG: Rab family GTPase [Oscillatoria sp. PMC 1051.18]|uniref:Rab family GTPase n=1 Tax=Oscillatoria salina TaxID=331517 RepID=UPI0013BCBBB0|nr:Rab family GTPase [Oscillatoria salina]MBZ8182096.1 GTP-binding protein [Oscillatoria salina IIICB1]MEC4891835.1 Rab family GTPase [Oscillatoria sp. PMC 1050.18]MEC5028455.1 Rab family GTPase [Oscillatoria sp. PMC 1051.18]NET89509.1 GTP-binding protein [Kamptonema sp. SIO1D9]